MYHIISTFLMYNKLHFRQDIMTDLVLVIVEEGHCSLSDLLDIFSGFPLGMSVQLVLTLRSWNSPIVHCMCASHFSVSDSFFFFFFTCESTQPRQQMSIVWVCGLTWLSLCLEKKMSLSTERMCEDDWWPLEVPDTCTQSIQEVGASSRGTQNCDVGCWTSLCLWIQNPIIIRLTIMSSRNGCNLI